MRSNKGILLLIFLGVLIPRARAGTIDRIVATIGVNKGLVSGTAVTRMQVIRRMKLMLRQQNLDVSTITKEDVKALFQKALEAIVEDIITADVAANLGVEVTDKEVDKRIEAIKKQNGMDDAQLAAMIKKTYGFDNLKGFKLFLKKQMLREKAVALKVRPQVHVSDAEVRDLFLKKFKEGKYQPAVYLAHIVFVLPKMVTLDQVAQLLARLKKLRQSIIKGRISFKDAARKYSQDATASRGGVIDWYSYEELDPRIGEVVFSLKKGEISSIVPGNGRFHIFKVLDKKWVPIKDTEELKARIRYDLFTTRMKQRFLQWINKQKQQRHYEVRVTKRDLQVAASALNLR